MIIIFTSPVSLRVGLEGGTKRATDPLWSLKVHTLERVVTKPDEPVIYYLADRPKRGFVARSCWLSPQIHSCRLLMLGKKSCYSSSSVALQTSQPHISRAELQRVFWHRVPDHLYSTPGAFIFLLLFELQYVVCFQVKPLNFVRLETDAPFPVEKKKK